MLAGVTIQAVPATAHLVEYSVDRKESHMLARNVPRAVIADVNTVVTVACLLAIRRKLVRPAEVMAAVVTFEANFNAVVRVPATTFARNAASERNSYDGCLERAAEQFYQPSWRLKTVF